MLIAVHGCVEEDGAPPNIILITADDMGLNTGRYGDDTAPTPNLDRLADEGILFTRAYVTQSSCSPSRSSILTGLYPHQNGQLGLANAGFSMKPGVPNLPTILYEHGYYTGSVGKIHVEPESELHFDFKHTYITRDVYVIAHLVDEFISLQDSMPFFLMIGYSDPHKTKNQYMGAIKVDGIPEIPLNEDEVQPFDFVGLNTKLIRQVTAGYYNCVERLDVGVGLIMDVLARHQLSDKTVVAFISDNGPPFTRAKTTCYEAGVRVPFIVRWPGMKKGVVRDELVSTVDILPTILDAAGIEPPDGVCGSDLRLLLRGRRAGWRETVCTEYNAHGAKGFYPRRAIRNERYKLILNLLPELDGPYGAVDGCPAWFTSQQDSLIGTDVREAYDTYRHPPQIELYDLRDDPVEWHNLADDDRYRRVETELMEQLLQWRKDTDDPYLDIEKLDADKKKYLGG